MRFPSRARVWALMRKDAIEVLRHPGTFLPAIVMVIGTLAPAFLVTIVTPAISGERLEQGELAQAAGRATAVIAELSRLEGRAQVQAFLFHQFFLLFLLGPAVGAMSIAAHGVIGEKQARTLEPLLATPLTTAELLLAKALVPLAMALVLTLAAVSLYLTGIALTAEPGVWRSLVGTRTLLLVCGAGPLVSLAGLQAAVIVSSRVNDPRSAQQLGGLIIIPITFAFIAQMLGQYIWSTQAVLLALLVAGAVNVVLLAIGIRIFQRETILMRWK